MSATAHPKREGIIPFVLRGFTAAALTFLATCAIGLLESLPKRSDAWTSGVQFDELFRATLPSVVSNVIWIVGFALILASASARSTPLAIRSRVHDSLPRHSRLIALLCVAAMASALWAWVPIGNRHLIEIWNQLTPTASQYRPSVRELDIPTLMQYYNLKVEAPTNRQAIVWELVARVLLTLWIVPASKFAVVLGRALRLGVTEVVAISLTVHWLANLTYFLAYDVGASRSLSVLVPIIAMALVAVTTNRMLAAQRRRRRLAAHLALFRRLTKRHLYPICICATLLIATIVVAVLVQRQFLTFIGALWVIACTIGMLAVLLWPRSFAATISEATKRIDVENEARRTAAQVLGGGLVIIGLLSAYGQLDQAQQTFRLNEEGQRTDRLAKAVEQIASDRAATQLGGLFTLERLAEQSTQDQDRALQLIAARVRELSTKPIPPLGNPPTTKVARRSVQAMIDSMGRLLLPRQQPDGRQREFSVDLSELDLAGYTFSRFPFAYAKINGTLFDTATFSAPSFRGTISGASFVKAAIDYPNLQHVVFERCDFRDASIRWLTAASGVAFHSGRLDGALISTQSSRISFSFRSVSLRRVNLTGLNEPSIIFKDVDLTEASFLGVDLAGARVSGVRGFQRANIARAKIPAELSPFLQDAVECDLVNGLQDHAGGKALSIADVRTQCGLRTLPVEDVVALVKAWFPGASEWPASDDKALRERKR